MADSTPDQPMPDRPPDEHRAEPEDHMERPHVPSLPDLLAARSLALALVDSTETRQHRAAILVRLAGGRRGALEDALRRVEHGQFGVPAAVVREAASTLRVAIGRRRSALIH